MYMFRKALCTLRSIALLPNNNSKFFVAIGSIPIFAALQSSFYAEVALPIAIGMVEHPAIGSGWWIRTEKNTFVVVLFMRK